MNITRICGLYFSPTGNTAKIVCSIGKEIAKRWNVPLETVDFTLPESRKKTYSFGPEDFLIAGSPVYAGKLPNKILPDFQRALRGSGTPAAVVVTFGNRNYDNAPAEFAAVLCENGFHPVAGAAFVCEHAFSARLAAGRPDGGDFQAAKQFADRTAALLPALQTFPDVPSFIPGDAAAPYYVPKGTDGQPARFLKAVPVTDAALCTRCGRCAAVCPMGSISPDNLTEVTGICIKCQACIRVCPGGAKTFQDTAFLSHVQMLEEQEFSRKEHTFFFPPMQRSIQGRPQAG